VHVWEHACSVHDALPCTILRSRCEATECGVPELSVSRIFVTTHNTRHSLKLDPVGAAFPNLLSTGLASQGGSARSKGGESCRGKLFPEVHSTRAGDVCSLSLQATLASSGSRQSKKVVILCVCFRCC
jgi:hypothetical protein